MGPIVLLKNFTFALSTTDTFTTDWISFPSEHQNATLHAHLQTLTPTPATSGVSFQVESSFDSVEHFSAGSAIATSAKPMAFASARIRSRRCGSSSISPL